MKKALIFFLLIITASFSFAFSPQEWKDSLDQSIKADAEKNFSDLFKHKVTIRSAGGIIVGQIILEDVYFPEIGRAPRIILSFNPVKYLYKNRDIIPALTKITVENGEFDVIRDKKNRWNILSIFQEDKSGKAAPPPFSGKLIFKNCRIKYFDEGQDIRAEAAATNGEVDLRNPERINFNLSAKAPETVKARGFFYAATGKYELNVSAQKLPLEKWAHYLPNLKVTAGTADLSLKLSPPKTKGWNIEVVGKASFANLAGRFQAFDFTKVMGDLIIDDEKLTAQNLKAEINQIPLTLNGRLRDFANPNLDISVSTTNGTVYEQKFSGKAHIVLTNKLLTAQVELSKLYKGKASGKLAVDLHKDQPQINLVAKFYALDLAAVAQNASGIEGQADGTLELFGPLNNIEGKASAILSDALVLGQPMQNLTAAFSVKDGDLHFENICALSPTASFDAKCDITRDANINLEARATGLRLSGQGLFGPMEATLNQFIGNIRFKLDHKFLAAPLRNMSASGSASLSNGQIGEQTFTKAQGKIQIGEGRIQIGDAFISSGTSTLYVSGETGVGFPTRLKISGSGLKLEDLKLLNHVLPPEAKDPAGLTTLEVEVTGFLSRETQITSFDPLLDLTAKGNLSMATVSLAQVPITKTALNFSWHERSLSIPEFEVKLPDSALTARVDHKNDGTIRAALKGAANLSHFQHLFKRYGSLNGRAGINLILSGDVDNPILSSSFWISPLKIDEIHFDSISGSLNYSDNKLTLLTPMLFKDGKESYTLSGSAAIDGDLDLYFKIPQADLNSTYHIFEKLRKRTGRWLRPKSVSAGADRVSLGPEGFSLNIDGSSPEDENIFQLYSANGKKDYPLKAWNAIRGEFEKKLAGAPAENIEGQLTADLRLQGETTNPYGKLNLKVTKGKFRSFGFDEFSVSADVEDQGVNFQKMVLTKGSGNLSAQGSYSFDGSLSMQLTANDMPLDLLQVFLTKKEFKGSFNLNADISGSLENPKIVLAAAGSNLGLAGIDFDKASLSFSKEDNTYNLQECTLVKGKQTSYLHGSVNSDPPGQVEGAVNLKGNAIGLLNLFTDEIRWLDGNASVIAKIQGTLENPLIEGKAFLAKGKVYARALDSTLEDLKGEAMLDNNSLQIKALTGIWVGEKTRGWFNPLGLAGTVDLSKILSENGMVDVNLAFSPTRLHIAFPNLYVGNLTVKELFLQGPLHFDLSRGPRLQGKAEIDNAVITVAQAPAPPGKAFPLEFNLEADLKKNVYAAMGNVNTLNLSNIFMNLEIAGEGFKVQGDLANPSLLGRIDIKRGTVNIFNRGFNVLTSENQKKYFPSDSEKVKENTASFSGESGPAGVLPNLNLTSVVNVENQEKDADGNPIKKNVIILARLQGVLGAAEEIRGLKIALSGFSEDKTKSPPEMLPAAYSEQDLKVMLLPDFIKSMAGIGKPGETAQVDTNVVVADYVSSRVQTVLFRSLEREAEQRLGLESLTLEYNLGPKVKEAMGIKDIQGIDAQKPAWSVGFVKGFFDRLYLDVRYAEGVQQTSATGANIAFNYQLTYKITPIWSILYYREPASLNELTTGYQKVTLKAGFYLW